MYLLDDKGKIIEYDDLDGINYDAFIRRTTAESGGALVSLYHGYSVMCGDSNPAKVLFSIDYPVTGTNAHPDLDGDGISDALEVSIGSSYNANDTDGDGIPEGVDTDGDGIPDMKELWGNDGFSYAWGPHLDGDIGPITRPNVYVYISYMTANEAPPTQLKSTVEQVFLEDSSSANPGVPGGPGTILAEVQVAPYPTNDPYDYMCVEPSLGCDACPDIPAEDCRDDDRPMDECECPCTEANNCVTYDDYKSEHFTVPEPEKSEYFYWGVFVKELASHANGQSGSQGFALGMVAPYHNPPGRTEGGQIGGVVHELGHNFFLHHNGNGNRCGYNSTVHESVMNYRYAWTGIGAEGRFTYSHGDGGCHSCSQTQKADCMDCSGQCTPSIATQSCSENPSCASDCDCDIDEWGNLFLHGGPVTYSALASPLTSSSTTSASSTPSSPAPSSKQRRFEFARQQTVDALPNQSRTTPVVADPAHYPNTTPDEQRWKTERVVRAMEAKGAIRGEDFFVSDDGQDVWFRD